MTTKEKIKALPYSQQELAVKLDVSINTVKSWTRKTPRNPNRWVMKELAKLFKKAGLE